MESLIIRGKQSFMNKEIPVVLGGFGEDKKCISDKAVAEIHNVTVSDIRKAVNRNITRFKESIDFIDLKSSSSDDDLIFRLGYSNQQIIQSQNIYLLSERGYAKLIKIMDTDLAWEIHDKLIDEYFELREEKENTINLDGLSTEMKAIIMQDKKLQIVVNHVNSVDEDLQTFKQELPLLGCDMDRITTAAKKMGVKCLGGKDSNAYKNRSIRQKVYTDIYDQLKRQFGVSNYKSIKRNQCDFALKIIEHYALPMVLQEEIRDFNAQMCML